MAESAAKTSSDAQDQSAPHLIRITDHGKMKAWVSFALTFLETNENRPVVFHTLPASPIVGAQTENANDEAPGEPNANAKPPKSLSSVTNNIPRLVSVVEIVKREFIKHLEANHSPRLAGLHQYNELGCLEDLGLASSSRPTEEDRASELARVLSGKNHVKQKQTPYLKITLSNCAIPELAERGATYQPPILRKISKSAKLRAKKRAQKEKAPRTSTTEDAGDPSVPG